MWIAIGLGVLLLLILSVPAGPKCPQCEKHFTSNFKAVATRMDVDKTVALEFNHCFYCKHKWDIKEDGKPVDEHGNYI